VGEGVEGQVGPVLRGRSGLEPREGQATAGVPRAQGSEVWKVAVKGRSLNRRGKPCGCGVDLRGGAQYPELSQAALICKQKFEGREAGLDGKDVRRGAHEAVCRPSLDLCQNAASFLVMWTVGKKASAP